MTECTDLLDGCGSVKKVQVPAPRLHGVNEQLVTAVEAKHDDLEEPTRRVEPEAQLAGRSVLLQIGDEDRMLGSVDGISRIDPVLARGIVNLHAT